MTKEEACIAVEKVFMDLCYYGFCDTKEDRKEFVKAEEKIKNIIICLDTDELVGIP